MTGGDGFDAKENLRKCLAGKTWREEFGSDPEVQEAVAAAVERINKRSKSRLKEKDADDG